MCDEGRMVLEGAERGFMLAFAGERVSLEAEAAGISEPGPEFWLLGLLYLSERSDYRLDLFEFSELTLQGKREVRAHLQRELAQRGVEAKKLAGILRTMLRDGAESDPALVERYLAAEDPLKAMFDDPTQAMAIATERQRLVNVLGNWMSVFERREQVRREEERARQVEPYRIALSEEEDQAMEAFEEVRDKSLLWGLALGAKMPSIRARALYRLNGLKLLHGAEAERRMERVVETERVSDIRWDALCFLQRLRRELPSSPKPSSSPRDLRKSVLNPDLEALCACGMLDPNDPDELDLIAHLYFARGCERFEQLIPEERRIGSWRRFYQRTADRMEDLVAREYDFDALEDYVLHGEDAVLRILSFCRLTGWFSFVENDQYSTCIFSCKRLPGYPDERALALCLELQREFGSYPPPHDPWHPSEANASLREGAYDIAERSRYGERLYGEMRYVGQIARDEAAALGVEREGPEYWVLATLEFAQVDEWGRFDWLPLDPCWDNDVKEAERCRRVLDEYAIDPARLEVLLRGVLAKGVTSDPAQIPALFEAAQKEVEWHYDLAKPAELLKAAFKRPADALRLALMRLGLLMTLESCFGVTHKVPYRAGMFLNRRDLEEVDLSKVDTSAAESLEHMLAGCESLRAVDLSPLDTSHVTDMSAMFGECKSLSSVSFGGIDTSHVIDLSSLFGGCKSLRSIDLSEIDSSRVTNIDHMFSKCESLREVDLSPLDTSRATDMSGMFNFCASLERLPDLTRIDTSHVEDMGYMFHECTSLRTADLRGVNLRSVRSMWSMFRGCASLERVDLSGLIAPELERVDDLFEGCTSLVEVDLSRFKATKLRKLGGMFAGCTALRRVDLSGITVVEDAWASRVFEDFIYGGCPSLESFTIPKSWPLCIEGWRETLPAPTAACGKWWSVAEGRWMTLEEIVARGPMADTFTNVER